MKTECSATQLEFHDLQQRQVIGKFDGGEISSDGGGVLLREVEKRTQMLRRLSQCFIDHRDPNRVEHALEALIKQRVMAIALGYEDLNDHDEWCRDSVLALLSDCQDVTGASRSRTQDRGKPLAGKSTLNRLELTPLDADSGSRYKKIVANASAMDALLVDLFLASYATPPQGIVLDVDATDDPVHGRQEGRFFHGYYGHVIYPFIFFVASSCCARVCVWRIRTVQRAR